MAETIRSANRIRLLVNLDLALPPAVISDIRKIIFDYASGDSFFLIFGDNSITTLEHDGLTIVKTGEFVRTVTKSHHSLNDWKYHQSLCLERSILCNTHASRRIKTALVTLKPSLDRTQPTLSQVVKIESVVKLIAGAPLEWRWADKRFSDSVVSVDNQLLRLTANGHIYMLKDDDKDEKVELRWVLLRQLNLRFEGAELSVDTLTNTVYVFRQAIDVIIICHRFDYHEGDLDHSTKTFIFGTSAQQKLKSVLFIERWSGFLIFSQDSEKVQVLFYSPTDKKQVDISNWFGIHKIFSRPKELLTFDNYIIAFCAGTAYPSIVYRLDLAPYKSICDVDRNTVCSWDRVIYNDTSYQIALSSMHSL